MKRLSHLLSALTLTVALSASGCALDTDGEDLGDDHSELVLDDSELSDDTLSDEDVFDDDTPGKAKCVKIVRRIGFGTIHRNGQLIQVDSYMIEGGASLFVPRSGNQPALLPPGDYVAVDAKAHGVFAWFATLVVEAEDCTDVLD